MNKRNLQAAVMLLLILILAGCRPTVTVTPSVVFENTLTATSEEKEAEFTVTIAEPAIPSPTKTAQSTPTGMEPSAVCPAPVPGSKLFVDEENGFCLLYPENMEQSTYSEFSFDRAQFILPAAPANAMEAVSVSLVIESNGSAKELTSNQYARKWLENFAPGIQPEVQDFMLNGQKGALLNLETEFGPMAQNIFLVANEMKYRMILSPMPGTAPELEESLQSVWKTVIASIAFFPPQSERKYLAPEDVCPQERAGYKQYIRLTDGYCLLYPSDFEPAVDFPGEFNGGPVLEANTAWGDVRASLTVGTAGQFAGQTINQVLDSRREFIDTSSVKETTIAGCPAVVFRDPRGPWASRQAMILRDGFVYTLVNQPWEPQRFPDGMVYLDSIWDTVTDSLAFFDPWR